MPENRSMDHAPPIILTIAGSDSSGGAGIQADLKTFSALGGYGASVITAVTAQNTKGVSAVHTIPSEVISAQLDSVFTDLDIKAVKIGMLSEVEVIERVSDAIKVYRPEFVILDPVMVAKSGDSLLNTEAIEALKSLLIPKVSLLTPNLPEASALLDIQEPQTVDEMRETIRALSSLDAKATLLKGGHLNGDICTDLLLEDGAISSYQHPRIPTSNTHGTGCTLSSAIATFLGHGMPLEHAVKNGTDYVHQAILNSDKLNVGSGHGPLSHFYKWWP